MFEFEKDIKSHMPFVAYAPGDWRHGRQFCCIMVNGKWKIHQYKDGSWQRVNTGLPEDATECSPTAEYLFGVWHLTFIAVGAEGNRMFRLYHIADLDKGVLPVAVCPADVGFLQKNRLVSASRHGPIVIEDVGKTYTVTIKDAEYLYRVSYDPHNPARLFISGQTLDGKIFSRIYQYKTNDLWELECDGFPAYKAAYANGTYYYALKVGNGFEDRRIVAGRNVRTRVLSEIMLIDCKVEKNDRKAMSVTEEFE